MTRYLFDAFNTILFNNTVSPKKLYPVISIVLTIAIIYPSGKDFSDILMNFVKSRTLKLK